MNRWESEGVGGGLLCSFSNFSTFLLFLKNHLIHLYLTEG
uniref:Uncharacterized protein n=1 Tax=Arundo donax TaxID=35708 RepID=A0A0A9BUM6_ARUDO